jgi:signal peptidase
MTQDVQVAGPKYRPRHRRAPGRSRRRRLGLLVAVLLLTGAVATVGSFWLRGYRIYVVHTGSMEPTYLPGDLVVDRPAPHVRPGEVITFRHSDLTTDVVTHRVTAVTPAGLIHTKGDANRSADVWEIRPDQVQGRVTLHVRGLGYLAVYLKQPAGLGSLITALLAIVLLWGLFFPTEPRPQPAA